VCGIIGYVGYRRSQDVLFAGLKRLEYRGYDSAGVAWREDGRTECVRAVGNLDSLETALASHAHLRELALNGSSRPARSRDGGGVATATAVASPSIGIGHTRWATHGSVTERNAHPHADAGGHFRIVLNGIIENYRSLRERLAADLIECSSDTDAEVVAQLIALNYDGDLADAVRRSLGELTGHYAIVAMCDEEPDTLVGVRHECPLVVGIGDGEHFIASSISAFIARTREVAVLLDDEIVVLRANQLTVSEAGGLPHRPASTEVDWDDERCEKDGFETFMLKEIHEQAGAVADTLSHWRASRVAGANGALSDERLRAVNRIVVVGCGTSYHAGLAGRLAIERWARIPVDVEVASEFRYRDPIIAPGTLVLAITQSGETADTLAAMRLARARGATVVALTNAVGSQATRDCDEVLFTRAGIEMGVAATKTFVAQVVLLYALALRLAGLTEALPKTELAELQSELELLSERIDDVVSSVDELAQELGKRLAWSPFFLYLGRLAGLPVAMEGALKLKEISYVPTDAYAAGEMKHGPIALLGPDTPVVCVATEESVLPKLLSNLSEARARGARVLAVASAGCEEIGDYADHVFYVPRTDPLLQVVLGIVPLQLFAYHLARARALNVDQPRNLAKTVTVE
jgi:glutamine---fructose-6-phosphate transaminase (isomerizing)